MASRRKKFDATAIEDLDQIFAFVSDFNLGSAARIIDDIVTAADVLHAFPTAGRPGRVDGTRELIVRGTPCILIYRVVAARQVRVLNVVHAKRQWPPDA